MIIKNLLTNEEILARYNVTHEQVDKASRIIDCSTGEVFYQVSSQTTDATYEIRYFKQFNRCACNCKAGQVGNACWHVRSARAAAHEYLQEQRIAMAKEVAGSAAKLEAERAEKERLVSEFNAGKGVRQAQGFSLLK